MKTHEYDGLVRRLRKQALRSREHGRLYLDAAMAIENLTAKLLDTDPAEGKQGEDDGQGDKT